MSKTRPTVKIVLVGPVTPYRGGIAQYTESLERAFDGNTHVEVVSFRRQYPKKLYPGETDRKDGADFRDDVNYRLDSNNPFTWLSTAIYIARKRPTMVLIDWWTLYWQPAFGLIALCSRLFGSKSIFICHNVYDHDASAARRFIAKLFLRFASGYVVHSSDEANKLRGIKGHKPVLVRQLPVFDIFPKPKSKRTDNSCLNVLFIGLIRPYKGLDTLLEAYGTLTSTQKKRVKLTVVGEVWEGKDELRRQLLDAGIEHRLEFVSDQEVVDYIYANDAVVLPYKTVTGSGIIPVAYYCSRPVIATNVGNIPEVVDDRKTGWLFDVDDPDRLTTLLSEITAQQCKTMGPAIEKWVHENSWKNMATAVLSLQKK